MYTVYSNLISPNKYSRPQKKMKQIKAIVLHWIAYPNGSAQGTRLYFENLKDGKPHPVSKKPVYASAHEIIDLDGDIIVCIPENEIAYNCGSDKGYTERCLKELGDKPNNCTYGIECTHLDWNGTYSEETYTTMIERCADLCIKYGLNPLKDIWTHQQVVGWKQCPFWFAKYPHEWDVFILKVKADYEEKVGVKRQDTELANALLTLQSKQIVSSPEYWFDNAREGKTVNGKYVGTLIQNYTKLKTLPEAVDMLTKSKVVASPKYWLDNAREGKSVDGKFVAMLISNMAKKLGG